MKQSTTVEVTGPDGLCGTVDTAAPPDRQGRVEIILRDGRTLLVPRDALHTQANGRMTLELDTAQAEPTQTVLPVIHEQISVGKRIVDSGRVRVRKLIREEQHTVDEPLAREEVTVERVPVDRFVSDPPPTRQEGDAFVIPIVEEVLVVEKRLRLKEELWVRKRTLEERSPRTVTLRREETVIERLPPGITPAEEPVPPPGAADAS